MNRKTLAIRGFVRRSRQGKPECPEENNGSSRRKNEHIMPVFPSWNEPLAIKGVFSNGTVWWGEQRIV
jgi:hypothetical protein